MNQKNINLHIKHIALSANHLFFEQCSILIQEVHKRHRSRYRIQDKICADLPDTARLLVEGLYQAYCCSRSDCRLSVPMSEHGYGDKEFQMSNLSHSVVKRLVDALRSLNWVDYKRGYKFEDTVISSIQAKGDLLEVFKKRGDQWYELSNSKREVIWLKGYDPVTGAKTKVSFKNNNQIKKWRSHLQKINQFLTQHAIFLDIEPHRLQNLRNRLANSRNDLSWSHGEPPRKKPLNFMHTQMRRIFARNSFSQGGRFYGGWWQYIPSEYRPYITINGYQTVEVDFSELHPRLLYKEFQKEVPDGDLYDLGIRVNSLEYDPSSWEYKKRRRVIKKFVNAMINDYKGRFRLNYKDEKIIGKKHSELQELVFNKHPLIREIQGKGYGLRFQFIDSQIAEQVMLELLSKKIVCLPIHDSFIVQQEHQEQLIAAMQHAYSTIVGGLPKIKAAEPSYSDYSPVMYPSGYPDFTYLQKVIHDSPQLHFLETFWKFSEQSNQYFTTMCNLPYSAGNVALLK